MDDTRAVALLEQLLAIPGTSGDEEQVAEFIVRELRQAGVPDSAMTFDRAHKHAGFGQCGNLIVKLPGQRATPRVLFMAHMDTVPLCAGCQPQRTGDEFHSTRRQTALGGDDRAGVAVVLNTALEVLSRETHSRPLTLLWTVQEEIGLVGARHVTPRLLGNPALAVNFDGGPPESICRGATGDDHVGITVRGIASHAGVHPERGVSAITVAAVAMADLQANGWLGLVVKGKKRGSSNIGVIQGGNATNVVTDCVTLKAEARSHDAVFRAKIVAELRKAFERAVKLVTNADGQRGSLEFTAVNKYEAFCLPEEHPSVLAVAAAIRAVGLVPETRIGNGGLDANWMTSHGIDTVTLGCGQSAIHTVDETLHIPQFLAACRIALELTVPATR